MAKIVKYEKVDIWLDDGQIEDLKKNHTISFRIHVKGKSKRIDIWIKRDFTKLDQT